MSTEDVGWHVRPESNPELVGEDFTVGWRGRAFVFKARGYTARLTGRRAGIIAELRTWLPVLCVVAASAGDTALAAAIQAEIDALGPETT